MSKWNPVQQSMAPFSLKHRYMCSYIESTSYSEESIKYTKLNYLHPTKSGCMYSFNIQRQCHTCIVQKPCTGHFIPFQTCNSGIRKYITDFFAYFQTFLPCSAKDKGNYNSYMN